VILIFMGSFARCVPKRIFLLVLKIMARPTGAGASKRGFSLAEPAWLAVLHALCAVAEGANVSEPAPDARCVAAVLGDPSRRLATMGGRDGMPRSLGSVLGSLVTRFVGGLRGLESRTIPTPGVCAQSCGMAVSRDGAALLVCDTNGGSKCIYTFRVDTCARLPIIGSGSRGAGPLQFAYPGQVWTASDGFVFVADHSNHRIQVLTPAFGFYGFVGAGQLCGPLGVCGDSRSP
jgi:hypothetical protein